MLCKSNIANALAHWSNWQRIEEWWILGKNESDLDYMHRILSGRNKWNAETERTTVMDFILVGGKFILWLCGKFIGCANASCQWNWISQFASQFKMHFEFHWDFRKSWIHLTSFTCSPTSRLLITNLIWPPVSARSQSGCEFCFPVSNGQYDFACNRHNELATSISK